MEKRKWLSLLLAVTMLFTSIPVGMFAEGEEPVVEETAAVEEVTIEEPAPAPEVKEEPAPAPAPEKKEEPTPAPEKKEEPAPVVEEKEEPAPVVEEKEEPAPVVEEKEEPAPVVEEKEEPAPVVEEKEEPAPSEGGESVPAEGTEPAAEPVVTEEGVPEGDVVPEETGTEPAEDVTPVVEPEPVPEVEEVEEETEAFKAGLAYLSSGEVFEDKQLQKAYGTVNSKAVVYATDRITGEGELSGNDVIRISANIEGQEKTLYVKNGRLTYLSEDETADYNDEKHEEGIACRGTKLDPVSFTPAVKPETEVEPTEEPVPTEPTGEEPTEEPVPTEPTGEEPTEEPVPTEPTGEDNPENIIPETDPAEPGAEEGGEVIPSVGETTEEEDEPLDITELISPILSVTEETEGDGETETPAGEESTEPETDAENEAVVELETLDTRSGDGVITQQPQDASNVINGYVTFTVTAPGATAYQWQYNKGTSTWYNCSGSGYEGGDTDTLTAKVTAGRNGFQFRCVVTVDGTNVESDAATMTVAETPAQITFTTQPADAQAPVNSYVTFTVAVEGATAYRWQYNKGTSTWYDCTGSGYEDADTATLRAKVTAGRNGFQFRCLVTVGNQTVESDAATMTVGEAPVAINFTQQPADAQAPVGNYVTFTVAAEGATAYQWQYNKGTETWYNCSGTGYEDADTATLRAKVTAGRNGFQFRCIVTVGNQTAPSNAATMTVGEAPVAINFTQQPADAQAPVGTYVTFTVAAEGATAYQWQYNKGTETWYDCSGTGYEDADTATLRAKVTAGRNGFQFRCIVTVGNQTAASNAATMTVGEAPVAINFTQQPTDAQGPVNSYVTFTVAAEGATAYQWQYNKGTETWYDCSGTGYEDADTATLRAKVTAGRDGFQFRCMVTVGNQTAPSNAATMTVGEAPVTITFTQQPEDASGPVNSYVTFTVAAEGATAYQWQYNKGTETWYDCSGAGYEDADTATLRTKVTAGRDGFQFRCMVTVGTQTAPSEAATMTVSNEIVLNDVTYEILTSTTVKVVSYNGTATSLVIPETVNNMTVTEIGEEAFMNNTNLVSIDLPDTITVIRARAFKGCTSLSSMD